MRIGFDAKRFFHNRSGLGNYSRNNIEYLTRFFPDNEYILYTPRINNDFLNKHHSVHIKTPEGISKKLSSLWRISGIAKDIAKDNIDIFHGLSNELPYTIKKAKTKSIVTIHDLIFVRFPELYPFIDRKIYMNKFRKSAQNADLVIAISEQTKADIIEFLNCPEEKIRVVYQGCNPVYYTPVSDEQKANLRSRYNLPDNYILYVGTIEKRKNLLSIIKAVHQFNISVPIVAIGRHTDYMNEIQEYINTHKLTNQVIFLQGLDSVDLPVFYQMADVFVYPSIFEGFGIPIIEALTSGTPVITSTGSCFSEAGGNSSIYTNAGDIDQLGTAIQKVLGDETIKNNMIRDGLSHAEKFSANQVARNLITTYNELK